MRTLNRIIHPLQRDPRQAAMDVRRADARAVAVGGGDLP